MILPRFVTLEFCTFRLRLHEIRTGADLRSGPVLLSVYTDTVLYRAVASRIFRRSCHAPFRIFLHHSKSNRAQKKRSIRCQQTVWFRAWCLNENFYQSLPICTAPDVMAIVTTWVRRANPNWPGCVLTNRHQGILPWLLLTGIPPACERKVERAMNPGLNLLETLNILPLHASISVVSHVYSRTYSRTNSRRMIFPKEEKLPTPLNYIMVLWLWARSDLTKILVAAMFVFYSSSCSMLQNGV